MLLLESFEVKRQSSNFLPDGRTRCIYENGTEAESPVFSDDENIHTSFNGTIATKTVTVPDEAAGSKTITMTRGQTGTNLFITKLEIVRGNN